VWLGNRVFVTVLLLVPYAVGVRGAFRLILIGSLAMWGFAQDGRVPSFEDFAVAERFAGPYTQPLLSSSEELRFRTVIRNGVNKGLSVYDGATGKENAVSGPNFAGHYVIVRWGCGSPCMMAAIIDVRSGRVFPPPFHHGSGHSYFEVPWNFPAEPPLDYRLNSRLLIANICETDTSVTVGGKTGFQAHHCGAHYFVMNDAGPKLIHRVLDDE
jgi:hypothetical protein